MKMKMKRKKKTWNLNAEELAVRGILKTEKGRERERRRRKERRKGTS